MPDWPEWRMDRPGSSVKEEILSRVMFCACFTIFSWSIRPLPLLLRGVGAAYKFERRPHRDGSGRCAAARINNLAILLAAQVMSIVWGRISSRISHGQFTTTISCTTFVFCPYSLGFWIYRKLIISHLIQSRLRIVHYFADSP